MRVIIWVVWGSPFTRVRHIFDLVKFPFPVPAVAISGLCPDVGVRGQERTWLGGRLGRHTRGQHKMQFEQPE